MKSVQALYIIMAVTLAVLVIGVSCIQSFDIKTAVEVSSENPIDEDADDTIIDDKECNFPILIVKNNHLGLDHASGYLVNHINQTRETYTPPPKA